MVWKQLPGHGSSDLRSDLETLILGVSAQQEQAVKGLYTCERLQTCLLGFKGERGLGEPLCACQSALEAEKLFPQQVTVPSETWE